MFYNNILWMKKGNLFNFSFIWIIMTVVFIFLISTTTSNTYAEQATISWEANTEADLAGYKLHYGTSSNNYSEIIDVGNVTFHTVSGLTAGLTYFFSLTAYDTSLNESGFSDELPYTVPDITQPSAPSNLKVTAISTEEIHLSWDAPTDDLGVAGYRIYRDGVERDITTNIVYQDTALLSFTTYTYAVSTFDTDDNESGLSNEIAVTTLTVDDSPPTITSVSSADVSTEVIIIYSEPVESLSATSVSNYFIDNGIAISSALLASDQMTVTLITSPHNIGITYTLSIINVQDIADIPNVIALNTTETYTFEPIISNFTVDSKKDYEIVVNGLQNGATVYTDRKHTYTNVPTFLDGATYIITANNDKGSNIESFINFDVNRNVTVYVAHEKRINTKPLWMAEFTDTKIDLVTNNTSFSIFAKEFTAGTVTLGGNGSGGKSMYTIIVKKR